MKENTTTTTELAFILDRSGSMGGLELDTIGGFNALLHKQQQEPGACRVSTALFDNHYELLHDRVDIGAVLPLTQQQYYVRGSTALLDAMGHTIQKIHQAQKNTAPQHRADKVVIVIITDGMENASREYSPAQIRQLVEKQQAKYGWEFIFLGANIDAIATAGSLGIQQDRAANFHADKQGTQRSFEAVAAAVSYSRRSQPIDASWSKQLDQDYKGRKSSR